MKVLLINGSPSQDGCTAIAISHIARTLNERGIQTQVCHIGKKVKGGCRGCGGCSKLGRCVMDDCVNQVLDLAAEADGFVFASPVHYASPTGDMIAFMDRLFYAGGELMRFKPAAVAVVARRGGCSASSDALLKYPMIDQMPVVSADYWPMAHGNGAARDLEQDAEGVHTMETIGRNMAWMLKSIEAGKKAGIEPEYVNKEAWTNFVR